jgi:hypothetical protein
LSERESNYFRSSISKPDFFFREEWDKPTSRLHNTVWLSQLQLSIVFVQKTNIMTSLWWSVAALTATTAIRWLDTVCLNASIAVNLKSTIQQWKLVFASRDMFEWRRKPIARYHRIFGWMEFSQKLGQFRNSNEINFSFKCFIEIHY